MMLQRGDYQITTIVTDEPWCENCYFVHHLPSDEQLLIDPGDSADRIVQTVLNHGHSLKKILITHAHHDHVGAVAGLRRRFGISCHVHKADFRLMRQAHTYAFVFGGRQIEPLTAFSLYDAQETFEIGEQKIRVIHTPGHTSGSVCYYIGDFVFTGDTLLYQHVGRSDTPGSDPDQLIASVGSLVEQLPEETVVLPGHGRSWTIKEARLWWRDAAKSPPHYKRFGGI
jgi:glyoxylase-like metal-dependent hydrolase (beta-lactamase superfamily II)